MGRAKSLEIQVPTQAWISIFTLMDIDSTLIKCPEIKLKEYIEKQKEKTNVWSNNPTAPVYNIGTFLMMAYAFLVIPKEVIKKNNSPLISTSSVIADVLYRMEIRCNKENNKLTREENIIRHIRNSITHVYFELKDEGKAILLKDFDRESKTFEGEISVLDFKKLIQEYFKAYYSIYCENGLNGKNNSK